eukprot:6180265-Pleurochrysis_carterae.AAC.1
MALPHSRQSYAAATRRRSNRKVDHGVVDVLVYLIHGVSSPHDQAGRARDNMFDHERRAIECRAEVNARHMSYQCWIRMLDYSESVRSVNPVGMNENDRKAAHGRDKMQFGDRREHTMNGVRTRAGERGGDAKGIAAKGA